MPDTPRALVALQAIFADNTTADISPQDLRDFLVSAALITGTGELGGTAAAPTVNTIHAGSAHITNKIIDADANTYVDVEKTANSDIIESATGGTIRSQLSATGLELANGTDFALYPDAFVFKKVAWDAATGHLGINDDPNAVATFNPLTAIYVSSTQLDPGGEVRSLFFNEIVNLTADNTQRATGSSGLVTIQGAHSTSGTIVGVESAMEVILATAADMRNFNARAGSGGDDPGTITARSGLYVEETVGSGTVTTQYGVYIEALAVAGTNWAIYSLGGQSSHLGHFRLGDNVAPASAVLEVMQTTLGNEVQRLTSTATNDDPVESVFQNRVTTTDATVTTLHTFTIPTTTTVMIQATVVARRTGGSAGTAEDGAGYQRTATIKNVAGTATIIGAVAAVDTQEDQVLWDCTIDVTGATARIRVTGAVNNNITWHATSRVYSVSS